MLYYSFFNYNKMIKNLFIILILIYSYVCLLSNIIYCFQKNVDTQIETSHFKQGDTLSASLLNRKNCKKEHPYWR